MSYTIKKLTGLEILDSRGRPTVQATCELKSGAVGSASVPSGASTGTAEALELRDGDPARYAGLGCRKAAQHISQEIHKACQLRIFNTQAELDQALINLDGTPNKARLGANAILAVSLAFARAAAKQRGVPLYQHFTEMAVGATHAMTQSSPSPLRLPRLTVNLFSGGKHAGGQVPIQDVLLVPHADTIDEGLAHVYAVYQSAAKLILQKYGMRALSADEGGLAPHFPSAEAMLSDAVEAIRGAGLVPGQQVSLAVDVASTQFFHNGKYHLGAQSLSSTEMIDHLLGWLNQYPIVSIEDGLYEDDWGRWPAWCAAVGQRALVLGDDFLCTNPTRIRRAIDANAANALLLKVNQIGTLTEAAEAHRLAKAAGWQVTVSARSGETEDNWLADLAVAWGDQIKVGSITQSERLAKYNRLLQIEAELSTNVERINE
jgi:enolase